MDVLTNLRTFLMVARCGGFTEAARRLHVVPSVAVKRVNQLEKTVGCQLFKRTTRSTQLTEAGEQFRGKAAQLVGAFDEVIHGLERVEGELDGLIRIMTPTTITVFHLSRAFASFMSQHPKIRLEIAMVDDASNPWEKGFDIAISGRFASYEGVTDVPLCPVMPLLCASPKYLALRGCPGHPRELAAHDCLVFRPAGSHWLFQSTTEGVFDVDVSSARMVADDNLSLREAAEAGCGLAILPTYLVQDAIVEGSLRLVLPEFLPGENWFRAYVPQRRLPVPRVSAFLEFLQAFMPTINSVAEARVLTNPAIERSSATKSSEKQARSVVRSRSRK